MKGRQTYYEDDRLKDRRKKERKKERKKGGSTEIEKVVIIYLPSS